MSVIVSGPAAVRAQVHHRRLRPFRYEFSHGTTMWLVDATTPNAAFPGGSGPWPRSVPGTTSPEDDQQMLAKVRRFIEAQELPWTAHRVLMLANARSLGYVWDPLSTFFCFDEEGRLEGMLADVHNTYGERH